MEIVSIIKDKQTFSPFVFYTDFLREVAEKYTNKPKEVIFKLFENGDNKIYGSKYRIDPITLPLLLSLFEQLKKYHGHTIELALYNNSATIDVLEFLFKADFFNVSGSSQDIDFPLGRNILNFKSIYLAQFKDNKQRDEHKIRIYSLDDDDLLIKLKSFNLEEEKRDYLNSHFSYKVREHYAELLFDNELTNKLHNTYTSILSELITNGVLHSKANTFALMFVDRYKTKFSISDNGIGLEESMKDKTKLFFYTPNLLTSELRKLNLLRNIDSQIINNLYVIFETIFYSSIKDREGLFDLMINVVLKNKGYFRIHTENCQVIISNRMMTELQLLDSYREKIKTMHNRYILNQIDEVFYQKNLVELSNNMQKCFISLYKKATNKYNKDIKYSSLRFFQVRYRGVHIEIEIPNP